LLWTKPQLESLAIETAKKYNLDPDIVTSIITVESAWNVYAMRYEPAYKYLFYPRVCSSNLGITEFTEEALQKMSYGLFQIMGAVCREYGFKEELIKMCEPENNLNFGCIYLKKLFDKYGKEQDVIASYNAGSPRLTEGKMYSNQRYVDKVYTILNEKRKLK